jgi:mannose-6-phosphate isomerase-like protein (cupin superfamily)
MVEVRRVVTGKNAAGKSVFVSDAEVEPVTLSLLPGSAFHLMWGDDSVPVLPLDGQEPSHPMYFPPAGGYRFGFFTIPPAGQDLPPDLDIAAALAEMEQKLPGMAAHMEPDDPGMHTTATVDFEVVISGQIICELDDGAEVTLNPGDTFVQNGTRHRWRNPGAEPAMLFVALIGAEAPPH